MEQKHLDEMEDVFQSEEFIDDTDFEVKVEPAKMNKHKTKRGRPAKEVAGKHIAEEKRVEKKMEIKPELLKTETPSPTVNPWADEKKDDSSSLSGASTWKFITGILIILLIFSVLTQGFRFDGKGATLSQTAAEKTALNFVNTNFLQPPFVAEVAASEELGSLYKVTLSVAGQEVDSYLTKDGKFFFPQGFDTSKSLLEQANEKKVSSAEAQSNDVQKEGESAIAGEQPAEGAEPETVVTETADTKVTATEVENVLIVPLQAKKWLFTPNEIKVTQGDTVRLALIPNNVEFTFAIPELGVEEAVSGPTTIEFVADKVGTFEFLCSSCEEFRGMKGILVVE